MDWPIFIIHNNPYRPEMLQLATYDPLDLKEVVLLVDRNIEEKYSPSIYNELSAPWPQGFVISKFGGEVSGLVFALPTCEGYARIIIFCVDAMYRNRGFGGSLLDELTKRAMTGGFKALKLEVRVENFNAIEFYKKRGFSITGNLPGFYNDGGEAHKMIKFLDVI